RGHRDDRRRPPAARVGVGSDQLDPLPRRRGRRGGEREEGGGPRAPGAAGGAPGGGRGRSGHGGSPGSFASRRTGAGGRVLPAARSARIGRRFRRQVPGEAVWSRGRGILVAPDELRLARRWLARRRQDGLCAEPSRLVATSATAEETIL